MTLIVSVNGPETIWMLADRRLSKNGMPMRDDARKVMTLETPDGVALIGYAGIGETGRGTEPAEWMSAILRGRNETVEYMLGIIAAVARREIPAHLAKMPGHPGHVIMASAFVGKEAKLYSIGVVLSPDRKDSQIQFERKEATLPNGTMRTPRIGLTGSGVRHLANDRKWARELHRLVAASDRKKISPVKVADYLAKVNLDVHKSEATVGPNCIVAWHHRKGGVHGFNGVGNGYRCYKGIDVDRRRVMLPYISHGRDMAALQTAFNPYMDRVMKAMRNREPLPDMDKDEMDREFAKIPERPDEKLR